MKEKKDLPIKKLTIIILCIIYSIFFVATSINLYVYSKSELSKTENLVKNSNNSLSKQIQQKISNYLDISKYPLLLPNIDSLNSILLQNTNYNINDYNTLKYICEMLLIQNDSITGAYIYNLNGNGVFASRNNVNDNLSNPSDKAWFKNAINSKDFTYIISNLNQIDIFFSDINFKSDKFIGITRKIIDLDTNQVTGLVLLTVPVNNFLNSLKSTLSFKEQNLCLYNSNGNLITKTGEEDLTCLLKDIHMINSYEPSVDYRIFNHERNLICYNIVPDTNWILINTIPKSNLYKVNNLYIIFFIINILFFLILSIVLYLFLTKKIFNPIHKLAKIMEIDNPENNLSVELNYKRDDEIGVLIKSYQDMRTRLSNLINMNYKNKIEQKELELRQLQNQINPHFIYNTLESIHMMAEINDDLDTSIMAEYFGAIIRYSMNRRINTVTLKEEMEIIDNYIYLQKIRFDQLFTIENMIDEELLNCEIIKMIIQPLIENAIYHALSECMGDGKIIIQGVHIDDKLVLTISDNGVGIKENDLKDLNDYINDKNSKFKGIALRNINKRLKLQYGEAFGLEIFSVYGAGTSMVLTLPFILHK